MELHLGSPTLCLNMIVKNESRIIIRLLESVFGIIDSYCICDTGSTDNTVHLIQDYFANKNIPGKIIFESFQNFSHNRNVALKSCLGMSDYVLFLDADMKLDVRDFDKSILKKYDSFTILQGSEHYYYSNKRIVKNNGLNSYLGVTHEYVGVPYGSQNYDFKKNELFIIDVGDGGSKSDKLDRDIRLLLKGIADEPANVRYYFYLANTYKDSGNLKEAISYYEKRIAFDGWNQEVWQSMYRMGFCYRDSGDIKSAICTWLDAYNLLPERIENLYQIVKYYREARKYNLANQFFNLALNELNKKLDTDGYLFLENDIYTYKLLYEHTIFAYYIGKHNINNEFVQIANVNNIDNNIYKNMLWNFKFYTQKLQPINVIDFTKQIDALIGDTSNTFYSSSSCLIPNQTNDGYFLNIRHVNYWYDMSNNDIQNTDKHISNLNQFLELTPEFVVKSEKMFDMNYENRLYVGIEDIKIFKDIETNQLIFTGTTCHKNNKIGIVTGNYDINCDKLLGDEIKCGFNDDDYCEKNWVFVDYDNSTHFVYKWFPLQIGKINKETNILNLVLKKNMPNIFSHARGSSCGFKYYSKVNTNDIDDDNDSLKLEICEIEIWFIVHLVSYEKPRHYYHLFAVLDENMNLLRYSAPFKIEGQPIEYCLSMVVERERVILNYSCWDKSTKLAVYNKKYIDSILEYTY